MGKYQPFLDLPAAQFQALVDDVAKRGVLLPIIVDENGQVLDGHQRRRAAAEAGVECPTVTVAGLSEEEKQTLSLTLNLFRRHLSGTERSKALQQLANLGLSTRRMADILGISKSQVHRDLADVERPDTVTDSLGRQQPATKPERDVSHVGHVEDPPPGVDPETGEILSSIDDKPAVSPMGDISSEGDAPAPVHAPSASPSVPPVDPALRLMADLSARRSEVAKWLAFDRHEQVIDSMTAEQRSDYRSFLLSVFNHASASIDYLDAPARLKAVN